MKRLCSIGMLVSVVVALYMMSASRPLHIAGLSEHIRVFQHSKTLPENVAAQIGPVFFTDTHPHSKQANLTPRWTVLSFGYTHCPDVCPLNLTYLAQEIEKLSNGKNNFRFLFASVDQEKDTLSVLSEYVDRFHQDIVPISASVDDIEVLGEYMLGISISGSATDVGVQSRANGDSLGDIWHTDRFYVFNPEYQWVAYYIARPKAGDLSSDLQLLSEFSSESARLTEILFEYNSWWPKRE